MNGTVPLKIKHHSLTGRITPELMYEAFRSVRKNRGAAGVDRQSVEMFEANLDQNLAALMKDLKRGTFQPRPALRKYIDKGGGKTRPLGIPTVTGKRTPVQSAFGLRGNHSSVSSASKTAVCRAQVPDGFGGGVCDPERLAIRNFFGPQGLDFDPLQRSLPGRRRGANDLAARVSAGAMRVREDARRISL
jgi:hypothetical protein